MRHSLDFGSPVTAMTQVISCRLFDCLHLFGRGRFRTGHADFRAASGNASTLPRSAGGNHFETLRNCCGM
jgi:hypothetical protein